MSDSSTGQIVGGIVGGVIGFIGGGGPAGAVKGFAIGYGVGGVIDPPAGPLIGAPRLNDKSFQSSAYGVSIPKIYGTEGIYGNVIYLENGKYKEVVKTESQGKGGGGAEVETVSYFATFAVALHDVQAGAVIRRIWLGGKLIFNASDTAGSTTAVQSAKAAEGFKYYDGTQTEPDPRIESVLGAGNAEAFVGTAYIIFYDLALAEYGNGLQGAPVKVEVASIGEVGPVKVITSETPTNLIFNGATGDRALIQSFDEINVYAGSYTDAGSSTVDFGRFESRSGGAWRSITGNIPDNDGTGPIIYPKGLNDRQEIYSSIAAATSGDYAQANPLAGATYQKRGINWIGVGSAGLHISSLAVTTPVNYSFGSVALSADEMNYYVIMKDDTGGGTGEYIYRYTEGGVFLNRISISAIISNLLSFNARSWRMWHDGSRLWLKENDDDDDTYWSFDTDLTAYQFEATIPAQVFEPLSTGISYPDFVVKDNIISRACLTTRTNGKWSYEQWNIKGVVAVRETLANIVTAEAASVGITSIDVSGLTGDVIGFLAADSNPRGSIGALQAAFLFDVVVVGYGLKCVIRGGEPILTIPHTDMGTTNAGGTTDTLTINREMDKQLPSRYEVSYRDFDREYDDGIQHADIVSTTDNIVSLEAPVTMVANEAAKVADILIRSSWISRVKFSFNLPHSYATLNPSDVVILSAPDRDYTAMIETLNFNDNGVINVTASQSQINVTQSSAQGSTGVLPSDEVTYISAADSIFMDVPMIDVAQDNTNFLLTMRGQSSWPGGTLLKSIDGGQSFNSVQSFVSGAVSGVSDAPLSISDGLIIERDTSLIVYPDVGAFVSVTEEQMMTGINWLAYGVDGRWEIMRYVNATANADGSYTLDTFIRGSKGTEWATGLHEAGDYAVWLDDKNVGIIAMAIERLRVENSYKSVTFSENPSGVTAETFTYNGVNLMPLSPVNLAGELIADWVISGVGRTRYPSSFWVTGVQPQDEPVIAYELDILSGGEPIRTLSSPTVDFTYTEADQITDFGGIQYTIAVNAYQLSATVGRGVAGAFVLSQINPSGTPLVGYDMDETTGTVANDSFGLNDGTYSAGVTLAQPALGSGAFSAGFDGATGEITGPAVYTGPQPGALFRILFNADSLGTINPLFASNNDSSRERGIKCYIDASGADIIVILGGGTFYGSASRRTWSFDVNSALGGNILTGTTYDIELIYRDKDDVTLEINSISASGGFFDSGFTDTSLSSGTLNIGAARLTNSGTDYYFDGRLDNFEMYLDPQ